MKKLDDLSLTPKELQGILKAMANDIDHAGNKMEKANLKHEVSEDGKHYRFTFDTYHTK